MCRRNFATDLFGLAGGPTGSFSGFIRGGFRVWAPRKVPRKMVQSGGCFSPWEVGVQGVNSFAGKPDDLAVVGY